MNYSREGKILQGVDGIFSKVFVKKLDGMPSGKKEFGVTEAASLATPPYRAFSSATNGSGHHWSRNCPAWRMPMRS